MSVQIQFLGAAGTVTGSKFLLSTGDYRILVDCGLFQGEKQLRELNWHPLNVPASKIDLVLLTHGHLDHTGYLPLLVKYGFKGKILATNPTIDITKIILNDTANINEKEAKRANEEHYSKHRPAKPLYTIKEANNVNSYFRAIPPSRWIDLKKDMKVRFTYVGHILGATFIEIELSGKRFVFSGDIGRTNDLLLYPPLKPKKVDFLFLESTYGGKLHPEELEVIPLIENLVNETIDKGGSVFIPSFSVERAQLMMVILHQLSKENKIPKIPMIVDSPMGLSVLELFSRTRDWHRLTESTFYEVCKEFKIVSSFRETMEYRDHVEPKIVIAGSGMLTGGRILNYLETQAQNEKNTLLFVGFQADGTRGRKLLEGDQEIKIFGKTVPFKMKVAEIEGLSAHADQDELLSWLTELKNQPERIFLIHGEKDASVALQTKLKENLNWNAEIPELFDLIELIP
ncbi:MBL fold metallo-hydrolase RNA specificity domain-containing protein [Namhaeicola litoreus]|uniref:MBL fold metallo-hydrolase RNA specificity domain-containing protein n=1 Tax=Namhaeicola litoreus TaxID=1052145 RepID=A0ABW3Y1F8_9FLAO